MLISVSISELDHNQVTSCEFPQMWSLKTVRTRLSLITCNLLTYPMVKCFTYTSQVYLVVVKLAFGISLNHPRRSVYHEKK